mmetsp:Transcript_30752/g.38048  ORF Transcript_30752/g.38048 Transcript_30752/m.38048 type:complete len:89 (-) Transcript_30752:45-311(-)
MIVWILTGLIILNEKQFYSGTGLMAIAGSVIICCIGIKLLTMKTKMLQIEAQRERGDSITSKSTCEERIGAGPINSNEKRRSTFISDM